MAVALRNRDRLLLVWPLVHEYLAAVLAPEGPRGASALVARAALGLLRVCQRLLPYKEDTADALLRSLGLVLRLRPSAAWELAQRLATEVRLNLTTLSLSLCQCRRPSQAAARPRGAAACGARRRRFVCACAPRCTRSPVPPGALRAPPCRRGPSTSATLFYACLVRCTQPPAQVSMPG